MQQIILEILQKIELNKEYEKLCNDYCNFDNSANLLKKDVEPIIKSFDPDFKYISRDKTFLKETNFKGFTVRFFIDFKSGITEFGYLVWKEGENNNFYKGDLHTLSIDIDGGFEERVNCNRPISTSLKDFNNILSKYFELFESFKVEFLKSQEEG